VGIYKSSKIVSLAYDTSLGLEHFMDKSKTQKAAFGVSFEKFPVNPYYEPLLWFMIIYYISCFQSMGMPHITTEFSTFLVGEKKYLLVNYQGIKHEMIVSITWIMRFPIASRPHRKTWTHIHLEVVQKVAWPDG